MTRIALALAFVLVGGLIEGRPAAAQALPNYPFCLFTGGDDGGFERCTYPSFELCLSDRQAEGGVCYANPSYQPAAEMLRRRERRG